jgi:hypothetical protein
MDSQQVALILVAPPYGGTNPIQQSLITIGDPDFNFLSNRNGRSWEGLYDEMGEEWMELLNKRQIKNFTEDGKISPKYNIVSILSYKC